MEALAILILGAFGLMLIGAILGWIAFARTGSMQREIAGLRARLDALAYPAVKTPAPAEAAPQHSVPESTPSADRAESAVPRDTEDSPPPIQPEPVAEPRPATPSARPLSGIEASLTGNWLVWVGAAALALGGAFLVKAAVDIGLFGPAMRIGAALLAGFAMIGAGEWLRRHPARLPLPGKSAAPAATTGAGLITLYAAIWAAFALYGFLPPLLAFALLALVAAGALALALLHGGIIAAFGIAGAFAVPLLIGSDDPNAAGLFTYVFAVAAAALAVARVARWTWAGWIAVAGGALWPLVWLVLAFRSDQAWALSAYLPAFLAAALAFGWRDADDPPPVDRKLKDWFPFPAGLIGAWFGGFAALGLAVMLADADGHSPVTLAGFAATALIALIAPWRKEGFAGLAPAAGIATALVILAWPQSLSFIVDSGVELDRAFAPFGSRPAIPDFLPACLIAASVFGLFGRFALARLRVRTPMAMAGAMTPVLILAAAWYRLAGEPQSGLWGLAALALTGLLAGAAHGLLKGEGRERQPGAIAVYALACAGSAGLAAGFALDQVWMSAAFALEALAAAWLWRKLGLPALKGAALVFGALAVFRLTVLGEAFNYDVGPWPILNTLLVGYGLSALALWQAARELRAGGDDPDSWPVQSLTGGALILGIGLVFMQIRHALNAGDLDGDIAGFREFGLHISSWAATAAALRWRLGPRLRIAPRLIEGTTLTGVALGLLVLTLIVNAWWGWGTDRSDMLAGVLLAYALPPVFLIAHAIALRRQGYRKWSTAIGLVGAAALYQAAILIIRWTAHGAQMNTAPVLPGESWAYSAVTVGYATALLLIGAWRRMPEARYAGLAGLTLATLKVFLFDLSGLDGVWRAFSFIGLGAALVGIGILYQRVIGPMAARERAGPD
ncbi:MULTISPECIES: DUF2339 domain-containing protein [Hyphobacterium]|uniref:DUF2339 domain-containing protein n=1 Tax=Hyphobacterium vulgare TaxID=1736751 RepID=A0ABV6ZX95_9PROT